MAADPDADASIETNFRLILAQIVIVVAEEKAVEQVVVISQAARRDAKIRIDEESERTMNVVADGDHAERNRIDAQQNIFTACVKRLVDAIRIPADQIDILPGQNVSDG